MTNLKQRGPCVYSLLVRLKGKRGMTLIELLISLFIIAMMVGVAIPLFSLYQRRNNLDSDAQTVSQMFSYIRALQNNPDSLTRTNTSGLNNMVVKVSTLSSQQLKIITVYSNSSPTNVIDQLILNSDEDISISSNFGLAPSGDFFLTFSGKTPTEIFSCATALAGSTSQTEFDCSAYLKLIIYSTKNSSISKTVEIKNTVLPNQYFSVSTVN